MHPQLHYITQWPRSAARANMAYTHQSPKKLKIGSESGTAQAVFVPTALQIQQLHCNASRTFRATGAILLLALQIKMAKPKGKLQARGHFGLNGAVEKNLLARSWNA